ncbi:EamA family transporter [Uliginosibacterium sp. H3]|uniref:EamA family transporter n=1 Tax=Uliginosibacterium silvisoli TaxID=3114758 RepID=A0ABU6K5C6_9RHOO|nr:EamA family transporter [Uliginosibacterium sp. H3]
MHSNPHSERLSREGILLLIGLALGWGFNWPVMKLIVAEVPPLTFRGVCLVIGGLGVMGLARLSGLSIAVPRDRWLQVWWLVFFNIIGWNIFATYGVRLLPAGRAALLGYTMPLWCVPLSVWLLNETLTPRRWLAIVLGIGGVLALMGEQVFGLMQAPIGAVFMLIAAWCWSTGMVLMKRWQIPINTVALTGWLMLLGGIPMVVAAFFVDGVPQQIPTTNALLGLLYNIVIGFMFGYWAWNRLVLLVSVSVSSLSSLITPLVGVAAGALMLGEQPGWAEFWAAVLILGAVAVINMGPPRSAPVTPAD